MSGKKQAYAYFASREKGLTYEEALEIIEEKKLQLSITVSFQDICELDEALEMV